MPTVPTDSRRPSADMPVPSETDLFMALATMKELGRIPTFDERFRGTEPDFIRRLDPTKQGLIEDRTKMGAVEQGQAEATSVIQGIMYQAPKGKIKSPGGIADEMGFKDIGRRSRAS